MGVGRYQFGANRLGLFTSQTVGIDTFFELAKETRRSENVDRTYALNIFSLN